MMELAAWDGKPMKRPCSSCGSPDWYEIRTCMEGTEVYDWCSNCDDPVSVGCAPDAYLPRAGMTFENLCDKMGKPIPIMSKAHKMQVMREKGVIEAGDRQGGSMGMPAKSWIEGTREGRKKEFNEKYRPILQKIRKDWNQKKA